MDRFLAGYSLLMDGPGDLPLLQLPLLPLPASDVLTPGPVAGPSRLAGLPSEVSVSPDQSREGPFDAQRGTSTVRNVPRALDSLPGCPYHLGSSFITRCSWNMSGHLNWRCC